MECPVCRKTWNLLEVRPKGLPCQHSLCQSCLGRLQSRACPQCRKAFVEPVPDNFTLVGVLEALDLERPRGSWWCTECNSTATTQCMEEHTVRRGKAALRLGVRPLGDPSEAVHVDVPPPAQQPAEDLIEELDLNDICYSDLAAQREEKADTLRLVRQRGVRRMTWVSGDIDPDWVLEVLRSAAPTLEELEVSHASEAHVAAVHGMPRLQRLDLHASSELRPEELPALPRPSCLRWLMVQGLPRATAVSLLQTHTASLDELWLEVGSEPGGEWPRGFGDLDAFLGQCRMWLTRLVLMRDWGGSSPCVAECFDQLEAARRVLPGCIVECNLCHGGELYEEFWCRVISG